MHTHFEIEANKKENGDSKDINEEKELYQGIRKLDDMLLHLGQVAESLEELE